MLLLDRFLRRCFFLCLCGRVLRLVAAVTLLFLLVHFAGFLALTLKLLLGFARFGFLTLACLRQTFFIFFLFLAAFLILTLRLGSRERALRTAERLRYATIASNIGDVRTLVIYPATTLFAHNTPEERTAAGVFDDTLRVSVGIEDPEDLVQDFTNAVETDTQGEQQ